MQLLSLALANFKNIESAEMEFSPAINCLLGNNGMGKSNLLDAIYYLSYCRSFTGVADGMLVCRGHDFTTLRGNYRRRGIDEEISAGFAPGAARLSAARANPTSASPTTWDSSPRCSSRRPTWSSPPATLRNAAASSTR